MAGSEPKQEGWQVQVKRRGGADAGRARRFAGRLRRVNRTLAEELVACGGRRARELGWRDSTVLLLSDSSAAKAAAASLLPGRVYASTVAPLHQGLGGGRGAGGPAGREEEAWMGVWVDLMMAALSDGIVVSPSPNARFAHSSFSMAAAEIGLFPSRLIVDGRRCLDAALLRRGAACRVDRAQCR